MPVRRALAAALLTVALVPAAVAAAATEHPTRPGWSWPLAPAPAVAARFEAPPGPYAAGHRGVDLRAAVGQQVRAPGPGVVVFAGPVAGRGVLSIQHAGGLRTTYEPVFALVAAGQVVEPGEPVATVTAGPGHCLPGTCLHWGARRGETYLDPLLLVDGARAVRLLPVWGSPAPAAVVTADRGPLLARQ